MTRPALPALAAADGAFLDDLIHDRLLSPTCFDHRAHLRLAYVALARHGSIDGAIPFVRERLRRQLSAAAASGHPPRVGYHETITRAWLMVVAAARTSGAGAGATDSLGLLAARPDLLDAGLLARHYTRGRLFTDEARARFVEPDLLPLPA